MATLQTFSWLRSYHSGINPGVEPGARLLAIQAASAEELDCNAHSFFDIQAIRRNHVARFVVPGVKLRVEIDSDPRQIDGSIHLLFHASGFTSIRFTFDTSDPFMSATDPWVDSLNGLFWNTDLEHDWVLPLSQTVEAKLSVRSALNCVFLSFYESFHGRQRSPKWMVEKSHEDGLGVDYLHELASSRRESLSFPFPVSFGTHIELAGDTDQMSGDLATVQDLLRPRLGDGHETKPVGNGVVRGWWGIRESKSVLLSTESDTRDLGTISTDAIQLTEYLNIRLASLWSIQRDTQRILAELGEVQHDQVAEWRRLVVTTTDDWSLHTRVGSMIESVETYYSDDPGARDLKRLKDQVDENVAAFQNRLDVSSERAGVILGVLFGVVAAVSITPVVKTIISGGETPERFAQHDWLESVSIDIAVVVLVGAIGLFWLRRASRRVRASEGKSWSVPPSGLPK